MQMSLWPIGFCMFFVCFFFRATVWPGEISVSLRRGVTRSDAREMLARCSPDARGMLGDAAAGRCWRHWPISLFSFDIVAGLGFGPSFSSSDFYRVLPSFSFVGGCCGSGTGPKRNRDALPIWNRVFLLFFFLLLRSPRVFHELCSLFLVSPSLFLFIKLSTSLHRAR